MQVIRGGKSDFRESEKFKMGRNGEMVVAGILKERGWFVIPSYDYAGDDGDKAPRLQGLADEFPVPDLDIAKAGRRLWAEVKTKAGPTLYRLANRWEHGIPLRHYRAYQAVEGITGTPVWLFVWEQSTGDVIYAELSQLDRVKRVYDGSRMSGGGMVFFPRSAFREFASLRADAG